MPGVGIQFLLLSLFGDPGFHFGTHNPQGGSTVSLPLPPAIPLTSSQVSGLIHGCGEEATAHISCACLFWDPGSALAVPPEVHSFLLQAELEIEKIYCGSHL